MTILIASFTFPPNKDGVSEAASVMAQAFLDRGWEVEVVTEPTTPARTERHWRGVPIHEFAITGSPHFRHPYRGDVESYQTFLQSGRWDVIVFHSYSWTNYLATPFLGRLAAKKVFVSHGYGALIWVPVKTFPYGLGRWAHAVLQSLIMPFWLRQMDRVVFLSGRKDLRAFYDHLLAWLTWHPGIEVVPNGVDPEVRGLHPRSFRQDQGIADSDYVFLCVANYSLRKDQGFACRAFRRAALPGTVLIFIGSRFNELSARWQQEDAQHAGGPGRVIWLEQIDRATTLDALAACDCFVLSASHEAQPIAILEAMREGKPWIAREAGCVAEMPGGMVVSDEQTMARALGRIQKDSGLRDQLGRQGRAAVLEKFNRQAYAGSYCRLIGDLV